MFDPDFFDSHDTVPTSEEADFYSLCDDCPGCLTLCRYESFLGETDYFRLIDAMVREINLLEAEIVRTRHVLACYLPEPWNDGLRQDIFCNLSTNFSGSFDAYDRYVDLSCNGIDPMDSAEHTDQMLRLRDGTDDTTYFHLLP